MPVIPLNNHQHQFMKPIHSAACIVLLLCTVFSCQQPLPTEEPAPERPAKIIPDPSAVPLSPEESLKTMQLPPGYHMELVASEPDIQEPVAMVWDGNGAMYVAEMRSYMQDINGTGERLPVCRITRLEDTNGDGKMDKHTVYIDSLILPRMMLMLDDRLVVNETYTNNMYSYRDKNGDGIADEKIQVYHNDEPDEANLEHQKSGLIWNIDNWIYVTRNPIRFRYNNGMLVADSLVSPPGGQWGLTQDNYGRMFFSSAGGETPALNFQENPVYGELDLDNQRDSSFDAVWPIIGTPDVQGGQERLRGDSTLNHFTASCGQTVFRGDRLPGTMVNDLFICEPVGRLIRRAKSTYEKGAMILHNAYDKREFLASTDMNFRPVNTATGPDGCLYLADMYHGIIQESAWTKPDSYIHPQIKRKKMDENINRGRIYRVVHDGYKPGPQPHLLSASNTELVAYLSHPNGWWRDNAQKLLVIRNDQSVVPALKKIALNQKSFGEKLAFWKKGPDAITRLHALWTLEGLKAIEEKTVLTALADDDTEIRKAALRMSEPFLKQNNAAILTKLESMTADKDANVQVQLALSLRYSNNPTASALLKSLQTKDTTNILLVKVAERSLQEKDEANSELKAITMGMDGEDRDLVYHGASYFKQLCITCHGPEGKGIPSMIAPPLAGSARVNGDKKVLINILMHGLKGPIDGKKYPDQMLSQQAQTDEYIASVLSYVRNSFGNKSKVVSVDEVKDVRAATSARTTPWTMEELMAMQAAKKK